MSKELFRVVDIGSNAVRVKTWDVSGGKAKQIDFTRLPIRLGAGVFADGNISAEIEGELREVLLHAREGVAAGSVAAVATSASREARNGEEVRARLKADAGIEIRVISGEEEARLGVLGALGPDADPAQAYFFVDIGGGSTQLTFSKGAVPHAAQSFHLGAVRARELHWPGADPPSPAQIESAKGWIEGALAAATLPAGDAAALGIGLGGTMHTLLRMAPAGEDRVSRAGIEALVAELAPFSAAQIIARYGIEPDRADVILAGALIAAAALRRCAVDSLRIVQSSIADGVLYDFLKQQL